MLFLRRKKVEPVKSPLQPGDAITFGLGATIKVGDDYVKVNYDATHYIVKNPTNEAQQLEEYVEFKIQEQVNGLLKSNQ